MIDRVDPAHKGRTAKIVKVTHPDVNNRAAMVGRVGVIGKVIKSRNMYLLHFDDDKLPESWEANPGSVELSALIAPAQPASVEPAPTEAEIRQAIINSRNAGYRDGYAGERANPPAWDTIPEWSNAYAEGYQLGARARTAIRPRHNTQQELLL